jgi:hypothetical protein
LVDFLVIISAQLLLLVWRPRSYWLGYVSVCILGADHESDLARRISGDSGIGVLSYREDFLARFLQVSNEIGMQPLVLSYNTC